jgi:hypothetical protein
MTPYDRIVDEMNSAVHAAYEHAADKMLQGFRHELAAFKLHNHKLEVRAMAGGAELFVGDDLWWYEIPRRSRAAEAIFRIGQLIDIHHKTWGKCLIGTTL